MQVELMWETPDESRVRWNFNGAIGVIDYVVPLNDTATCCVLSDHESVDVHIAIGWAMPFPNRHFKYLRQAILAAPPNMRTVVISAANPLTRLVIQQGLMNERLRERGVHLVSSEAAADALFSASATA